jgi:hypothetical protein
MQKQKRPTLSDRPLRFRRLNMVCLHLFARIAPHEPDLDATRVALPQPAFGLSIEDEHGYTILGGIAPRTFRRMFHRQSELPFPFTWSSFVIDNLDQVASKGRGRRVCWLHQRDIGSETKI